MKFYNISQIKQYALVCCILAVAYTYAQINAPSPYTRFGLGHSPRDWQAQNEGLGRIGGIYTDSNQVNLHNPATLTYLANRKIVVETGLLGSQNRYLINDQKSSGFGSSFAYLALGMNVSNRMSLGISLNPYSRKQYDLQNVSVLPGIGPVRYNYIGRGGFNATGISASYYLGKNLSIGAKLNYVFGNEQSTSEILLPDTAKGVNSATETRYRMSDVQPTLGIYYMKAFRSNADLYKTKVAEFQKDMDEKQATLKTKRDTLRFNHLKNKTFKRDSLQIGFSAVYVHGRRMNAYRDFLASTFSGTAESNFNAIIIDNQQNIRGSIFLPNEYSLGFSVGKSSGLWRAYAEWSYAQWADFSRFGQSDSTINGWQASLGLQLIPNAITETAVSKHIRYRLGAFYNSGHLQLRGVPIEQMGFTAGAGIPFRRPRNSRKNSQPVSLVNLGLSVGQLGTTRNQLMRERYVKLSLSFSLTDDWFQKRQYD